MGMKNTWFTERTVRTRMEAERAGTVRDDG
jgi:hypothetical protein